jgi:hypothetical protein
MEKQLITFELANLARKRGFEAKTLPTKYTMNSLLGINNSKEFLINDMCQYLLLCEMQRWLREKHDIFCEIHSIDYSDIFKIRFQSCVLSSLYKEEWDDSIEEDDVFDTYELALFDSIQEAFKLVKNKNNGR